MSSAGFIGALRYGATLMAARFTLYEKGVPIGEPFTAALSTGTFTLDRNSAQRRTGTMTVEVIPVSDVATNGSANGGFPITMPINPQSPLAPFGNEVLVEFGVATTNKALGPAPEVPETQFVSLGLYAIATSTVDDTQIDCTVTLQLYDRSWTIAQRTLKKPYNFPATPSHNFVAEMQALLNQVWNEQIGVAPLQFNIVPTAAQVPVASYNQGSNPWQACLDMATACGYELYFDANGIVTGKPIPNPRTQPISWNFTDDETAILGLGGTGSTALFGSAYSTPVAVSVVMTRDGIYNDIVVQGTGSANQPTYTGPGGTLGGAPILAQAADQNPTSPTYVGGGMGDVPNFVSSSLITNAGAQAMANNELQAALSSSWMVTITIPPNPTLDVDQVVTVTRPRVGLNNALCVIDTITHAISYADLTKATMRVLTNNFVA